MKILKCKLCMGEVDIVGNERSICTKIKCRKCGFTNGTEAPRLTSSGPIGDTEVIYIHGRTTRTPGGGSI